VNVMLDSVDMIVQQKLVQVIVQEMEIVSMEFVLVKMVGVVKIVPLVAQVTDKDVVEMENVLKDNVIVILDGLVMDVILKHVFMIVHNTDIAVMELVFAKKDIVVVIVHFLLNHNHVNVLFIVFVDVFNNVPKFMKAKVLDHHMNVIPNVHKHVFHYVLLEKCQKA
jgi:hypothetical protein